MKFPVKVPVKQLHPSCLGPVKDPLKEFIKKNL